MSSGFLSVLLSVLPLAMDTFAIAAVVGGTSRLTGWARWRISAVFVIFEGGMPLVGLALGASLGHVIGNTAEYLSGGLLIALGGYLWWADRDDDDDDDEVAKARRLASARGLALVGLALSISLDELAVGFGLGLASHHGLDLARLAIIVAAIAVQTLIASQLGLSLGSRVSNRLRERIEYLTCPGLTCLGGYQLTGTLMHAGLASAVDIAIGATLILIFAAVTMVRRPTHRGSGQPGQSNAERRPDTQARAWTASNASSSSGGQRSVRHVATRGQSMALHQLTGAGQADPCQPMNMVTCRHQDLSRNDANVFLRLPRTDVPRDPAVISHRERDLHECHHHTHV